MRTTLNIDDELLDRARRELGVATKTEAIEAGLRLVVERAAARRLLALRGSVPDATAAPRRREVPIAADGESAP